jgi:hypothetical protein
MKESENCKMTKIFRNLALPIFLSIAPFKIFVGFKEDK